PESREMSTWCSWAILRTTGDERTRRRSSTVDPEPARLDAFGISREADGPDPQEAGADGAAGASAAGAAFAPSACAAALPAPAAAPASVSICATTTLIGTVCPSWTLMSTSVPAAGDGI